MNLVKRARCHIRMQSRWASVSAVCMGISVFVRTVYYFGLINLRDLSGFELVMDVIFPMIIAASYLIMIKGLQLNSPTLFGGLIGLYAVNYLLLMNATAPGIIVGVLLVLSAGVFIASGLGYLPNRIPVMAAAGVVVLFRLIVVDLVGYIFPLTEFHPVAYLPEASNLFGILAVSLMAPALQLTLLPASGAEPVPDADTDSSSPEEDLPVADSEPTESAEVPELPEVPEVPEEPESPAEPENIPDEPPSDPATPAEPPAPVE